MRMRRIKRTRKTRKKKETKKKKKTRKTKKTKKARMTKKKKDKEDEENNLEGEFVVPLGCLNELPLIVEHLCITGLWRCQSIDHSSEMNL